MPLAARYEKTFTVEQQAASSDSRGRIAESWVATGTTIQAIVGSATPQQIEQYGELGHPVTHSLTQRGPAYAGAKPGDRLTLGGLHYYIRAIEDPAQQGRWTVYFCRELRDE